MRTELIQDPRLISVVLNMQDWVNRCKRNIAFGGPLTRVLPYTSRTQFRARGATPAIRRRYTLCEEPYYPRPRNYCVPVVAGGRISEFESRWSIAVKAGGRLQDKVIVRNGHYHAGRQATNRCLRPRATIGTRQPPNRAYQTIKRPAHMMRFARRWSCQLPPDPNDLEG